jgi:hypothetical protein
MFNSISRITAESFAQPKRYCSRTERRLKRGEGEKHSQLAENGIRETMYTFLNTFPIHYYHFSAAFLGREKEISIFLRRKRGERDERKPRNVMKLFSELC